MTPCDVCGQPVDDSDAHFPCEPDCPHRLGMAIDCNCDLMVHPQCCPICTQEAVS